MGENKPKKKKKETGHVQNYTELDYSQMLRAVWRAG